MFDAADTNHDGKLSREEFANMMRMKQAAEGQRPSQMVGAVMPRPTLPATQPKAQVGHALVEVGYAFNDENSTVLIVLSRNM